MGQVEGDMYLFRCDNYLETGDFCLRCVVKIFIYTHFLSAAQSLAAFRVMYQGQDRTESLRFR